ncbi:hypothetical protein QBC33DRAFT_561125 [Phialemonium atrogriseum]|uniref:Uncharacterized protein n=1 Tax=Phialemonium atrogriseum TaxID=1093897 RepID=A0AAJ0BVN2_9PEZI|nr:uncharacterized protein QBC33DRAFT_561125 [Phialemonium atrogriseum]KAK1765305.1 hypothetical protein QBC33DRAFT_561125 [Phialemonium atrogriseum]
MKAVSVIATLFLAVAMAAPAPADDPIAALEKRGCGPACGCLSGVCTCTTCTATGGCFQVSSGQKC